MDSQNIFNTNDFNGGSVTAVDASFDHMNLDNATIIDLDVQDDLTLSGLTASRVLQTDASKKVVTSNTLNNITLTGNTNLSSLTANQLLKLDASKNIVNDTTDYIDSTELSSALSLYVTITSLASTLLNYVTNSSLATTLLDYVTNSSLATTLLNYVTNSSLASTLSTYLQWGDLDTPTDQTYSLGDSTHRMDGVHTRYLSISGNNWQPRFEISDAGNEIKLKVWAETDLMEIFMKLKLYGNLEQVDYNYGPATITTGTGQFTINSSPVNMASGTASRLLQTDASKNLTYSNTLPSGCSATNLALTTPSLAGTANIFQGSANRMRFRNGGSKTYGGIILSDFDNNHYQVLNDDGVFSIYYTTESSSTPLFRGDTSYAGTNIFDLTSGGHLRVGNGSASAPSHSFLNYTNVGMYAVASNDLNFATDGALRLRLTTANALIYSNFYPGTNNTYTCGTSSNRWSNTYTTNLDASGNITGGGQILLPLGSASAPSYSFTGDTDTGVFSSTANEVALTTNGTYRLKITNTNTIVNNNLIPSTYNYYSLGSTLYPWADIQTMDITAIGTISTTLNNYSIVQTDGAGRLFASLSLPAHSVSGTLTGSAQILLPNGLPTIPSYSFTSNTSTGINSEFGGNLIFVTNGSSRLKIKNNEIAPITNNAVSNGNSSARWSNTYSVLGNYSGTLTTSDVTSYGNIIPDSSGTRSLGSSTNRFQTIYTNLLAFGNATTWDLNMIMQAPNAVYNQARCTGWNTYSNRDMKESITTLSNSLDIIDQIRPVSFTWKSGYGDNVGTYCYKCPKTGEDRSITYTPKVHQGFIAEEICEVLPYVCSFDEENKPNGVDYSKVVPVLVGAIQDLMKYTKSLEQRLADLERLSKTIV